LSFEVDFINLVLYQKIPFFLGFIFMTDTKKLTFLDNFILNAYPYNMLKEGFFKTFIYSSKIRIHFSLPFQNRIGNIKAFIFQIGMNRSLFCKDIYSKF